MLSQDLIDQLRKTANTLAAEAQGTEYEAQTDELARQICDDLETLEKRRKAAIDKP